MKQKAKRINNLEWRRAKRPGVVLLLLAALLLPALPALGKTASKRRPKAAATKKPAAAPVKKAAVLVKKAAAPVKKATPRKKTTAPVRRAAAPVVTAPAAEIPVVAEPAAIWQGCLQSGDVSQLASRLQLEENQLRRVLSTRDMLPLGEGSACVPYVGATGGERGAATAMFQAPAGRAADAERPGLLVVSRTEDSLAVIGREFRRPEQAGRTVSFPAADFAERGAELLAEVPAPVRWQIDVLVPQMLPDGEGYTVRVEFGQDGEGEREHLHSIEILETVSGKLVDGAWWVERKAGPSVIVGMKGTAYERALWLSPIEFIRKSRGVGPTARTVRRNFAAPVAKNAAPGAAKPGTKVSRIVTLRGFHLGVDLTAPTGTPIHAVGDGVVTFAGRRGGYGNLVIVDHGMGYQTYYAHMSAFQAGVKKGTAVMRGEVIGRVGSTGRSTAPHLHFETRKDSKYIDPYDETRQLDFWMLSAEEHERVALRLLAGSEAAPAVVAAAAGGGGQ